MSALAPQGWIYVIAYVDGDGRYLLGSSARWESSNAVNLNLKPKFDGSDNL